MSNNRPKYWSRNNQNKFSQKGKKTFGETLNFLNPYSFVPLSNKVCLLSESEIRSLEYCHDAPLKEALSGTITLHFEAMTPMCIRDVSGKNHNVDGKYYIPGSSVKGMIRSVFEILSMSNPIHSIADSRYSMRDLSSEDYELKKGKQQSGFLAWINNQYFIFQCENEKKDYEFFEKHFGISNLKGSKKENAKDKYRKIKNKLLVKADDGKLGLCFFSGYIDSKKHEYLFNIPEAFKDPIPVQQKEWDDFIFIHEIENKNKSWKFWKMRLNERSYHSVDEIQAGDYRGLVPCFFRTKKENGRTVVKDLGFSYLYRQPYEKTIHDFMPKVYHGCGIDLAQAVFGCVGERSLKGRVQFGNAFIDYPQFDTEQTFALGSPKPTFYPFYLKQSKGVLNNYFANDAQIAGIKRYLVRSDAEPGNMEKKKVATSFVPLKRGTEFTTKIRFFNLKKHELGALLSAITFYQQNEKCFHQIGFAKPFGYGTLRVASPSINLVGHSKVETKELYKAFIQYMLSKGLFTTEEEWYHAVAPLFRLASGRYEGQIRYPNFDAKEFKTIKNKKLSIERFSPKLDQE